MRCLYCGKELALFKRLRGGEFCSDEHRQRYRDEYTQLALNRLKQSTTPELSAEGEGKQSVAKAKDKPSAANPPAARRIDELPSPALQRRERQVREEPPPVAPASAPPAPGPAAAATATAPAAASDAGPSAWGGPLLRLPDPAKTNVTWIARLEMDLVRPAAPVLPGMLAQNDRPASPSLAGRVAIELLPQADGAPPRERGLEVREFVHSISPVDIPLRPPETVPALCRQPLEVPLAWCAPAGSPRLWQHPHREFSAALAALGEMAGLDFETIGWPEDGVADVEPVRPESVPIAPPRPEPVQLQRARPAPVHYEPVRVNPMLVERLAEPIPILEAEPAKASAPPPPEAVTKPLPVTLHGLAPARGKPAQVFTSAVTPAAEIQAPRSSGFPLRPTMILAPAGAAAEPAAIAEKAQKPSRKAGARVLSLKLEDDAKPAPAEKAPEPDLLGLPRFSMEKQGGMWSRPMVRLALAAAVLAAAGAGILLTSRGSGASRTAIPSARKEPTVVEAGPALATNAGWITDWFTDGSGPRPARHVDVLRGSLTMRDYRVQFEGQIDQGAIGWVFRANGGKNFYAEKVAIVKPGLEPGIALVRFAVIGGKEQPRQQVPLPIKVHLDTLYKIRLDVVGNRFTTWVQDQQVDQWTDDRIEAGGVGVYYDAGESARLKGTLNVVPLQQR